MQSVGEGFGQSPTPAPSPPLVAEQQEVGHLTLSARESRPTSRAQTLGTGDAVSAADIVSAITPVALSPPLDVPPIDGVRSLSV